MQDSDKKEMPQALKIGSNYVSRPPLSLMEKLDLPLRLFIWGT